MCQTRGVMGLGGRKVGSSDPGKKNISEESPPSVLFHTKLRFSNVTLTTSRMPLHQISRQSLYVFYPLILTVHDTLCPFGTSIHAQTAR